MTGGFGLVIQLKGGLGLLLLTGLIYKRSLHHKYLLPSGTGIGLSEASVSKTSVLCLLARHPQPVAKGRHTRLERDPA